MELTSVLKPYVMSIAGFDPTAGAGVLADIKCFEQHEVYGFGICTTITVQTDCSFLKNQWLSTEQVIDQISPLLSRFTLSAVKIGLIQDIDMLLKVIAVLKQHQPDIMIVMDPVLSASAGYKFHNWEDGLKQLQPVLKQIDLITPNCHEMISLSGKMEVFKAAEAWSAYCPVLLKGGHMEQHLGTDFLYAHDCVYELKPKVAHIHQKHGSGCVLSAAITANLAKENDLLTACKAAKTYTERFLNSNETLLGDHKLKLNDD